MGWLGREAASERGLDVADTWAMGLHDWASEGPQRASNVASNNSLRISERNIQARRSRVGTMYEVCKWQVSPQYLYKVEFYDEQSLKQS